MSKFTEVVELLKEYDIRHSSQGIPSVPGDGHPASSDPNIAGNAAQVAPYSGKQMAIIKPFTDEHNHHNEGPILPYPLEHVIPRLANMQTLIMELKSIIISTINKGDLTKPEKDLLTKYIDRFDLQSGMITKFIRDLDSFSV